MFIKKDLKLLHEIQDIANEVEDLGVLIKEDGEADMEDIEVFRQRYADIKDKLFKWRGKVDKVIAESLNPSPPKVKKQSTKKGVNHARIQPTKGVQKATPTIRISKGNKGVDAS